MTASAKPHTFRFESVQLGAHGRVVDQATARAAGERLELPGEVFLDLLSIPAGRFEMGAEAHENGTWKGEQPRHRVELSAFSLGQTLVTQAQWQSVAGLPVIERELAPTPSLHPGPGHPVDNVRWLEAVEFCARLSAYSSRRHHLPSEAQWEYACRAGSATPFHCGETLTAEVANVYSERGYADAPPAASPGTTTPVAQYPANPFGLYDMHGNLFEWCADAWHADYAGAPVDAKPWLEHGHQGYRPLRGGAWCTHPRGCRSAARSGAHQRSDHRDTNYGLRVATEDA